MKKVVNKRYVNIFKHLNACICKYVVYLKDNFFIPECDSYHYGKNCLQKCNCLYGTCDKKTGKLALNFRLCQGITLTQLLLLKDKSKYV